MSTSVVPLLDLHLEENTYSHGMIDEAARRYSEVGTDRDARRSGDQEERERPYFPWKCGSTPAARRSITCSTFACSIPGQLTRRMK